MGVILTENSTTALWVKLVQNAGESCQQPLDVELESYLVFMLMRHQGDIGLADTVIAPRYLQGMQAQGQSGIQQLQTVADQCLLYSGLFPQHASRRLVKARYYVDLGRSAYMLVAERVKSISAVLYENLSRQFVDLMDILQALRFSANTAELDSLLLIDYCRECDSQYARRLLQERYGNALLTLPDKHKN